MKVFKVGLILASVSIVCIGFFGMARKPAFPVAPPYSPLPNGEFPLRACYALYQPFINRQQFEWVKEAGFNCIRQTLDYKDMDSLMTLASEYGLYVTASMPDVRDSLKISKVVERYGSNPYFWGLNIIDEPSADKFQSVRNITKRLDANDPAQNPFVNLFPAVGAKQMGAPDYRTYVEEFVRIVNPPYISYDAYPISYDKDNKITVWKDYFYTLEIIRDVADKSNRPFWGYILVNKHWSYPKPTREYIRYQVFTNLAYGAQGLSYFTYLHPDYDVKGEYSDSPIDRQGRRTDTWYAVRDVNREVKNLEKVFLGSTVEEVRHTGKIPRGTKRLGRLPRPFRNIESLGAEGVVVSRLKNGKERYLMLLNKDVVNPQEVRIGLSGSVERLYGDGSEAPFSSQTITLSPAGYAIFRY